MSGWTVRVPASSANLGPGFDSFACALDLWLEVEVAEAGAFAIETTAPYPADRSNLVVRGFERLLPADAFSFAVRSKIPTTGGLGTSAAAYVAGLLAADAALGGDADVLALATELEGHPDNAAAAVHGGFVICAAGRVARIAPPADLAALVVSPFEAVQTAAARAALPESVPLADAVFNVAHGGMLAAALASGDLDLLAAALHDRLHQLQRSHLFPRSAQLLAAAPELGALGATVSGAGPAVLVWVRADRAAEVADALRAECEGWAEVVDAPFAPAGASLSAG